MRCRVIVSRTGCSHQEAVSFRDIVWSGSGFATSSSVRCRRQRSCLRRRRPRRPAASSIARRDIKYPHGIYRPVRRFNFCKHASVFAASFDVTTTRYFSLELLRDPVVASDGFTYVSPILCLDVQLTMLHPVTSEAVLHDGSNLATQPVPKAASNSATPLSFQIMISGHECRSGCRC